MRTKAMRTVSLTIRDVPRPVPEPLKRRAEWHRRSMQGEIDEEPIKDHIQSWHRGARSMGYGTQVKSISTLKANAAEILQEITTLRRPLVITQNGEARAVLQDVASYDATQETLALLKILALGQAQVVAGRVRPVSEVVARLRQRRPPPE
jgi:prevent-host-death family protein